MATVGEIEKWTQARVVALFRDRLQYDYLGNWVDRDNRNIEQSLLRTWLGKQGVSDTLITRALHELNKAATDTSKHLYDRNKAVYDLLRYGVKVLPGMGENKVTRSLTFRFSTRSSICSCVRPQRSNFNFEASIKALFAGPSRPTSSSFCARTRSGL